MLRYRQNVTVRRPAHTFRPQAPPRPRHFANQQKSTTFSEIGRNANELNGLEARARSELSERQRQKLQKKAERMANDIEDVAMTRDRETASDMTDRGDLRGMRIGDAVVGGPITTGIDAKLAKKRASLEATGDSAAAADAYAKFDDAERQFYDELPIEMTQKAKEAARSTKAAASAKGDTRNTPSQTERIPGNFEGDMAPLEGTHDEAEELAGNRGPYLREGRLEDMQPERKRGKQSGGKAATQTQASHTTNAQASSSGSATELKAQEMRLADQTEQETREEIASFQSMAHTAAEQIRAGATTLKETVMPKVAAGASMLKEKLQEDVIPKAKDAAAKIKEKFTEEIAPKAMDKAKQTADKLKHKVTDEWGPKAAEATKDAAATLRHKVTDEWAPKATEATKEAASELRHKVTDEWAPKATEATKDAAATLRHKVTDEWAPKAAEATKEAASRLGEKAKGSAPNVAEMLQESAAAAKSKVADAAGKLMGEAPSMQDVTHKASDAMHTAGDKVKEGVAYAKDKANEAMGKMKDDAPFSLDRMDTDKLNAGASYVKDKAADAAHTVADKAKDAASSVREAVDQGTLRDSAAHLKDQAASAMHTAGSKVRSAVDKAEVKFEEMNDRASRDAATHKDGILGSAAHRAAQAMDAAGTRAMEVGGTLAHKAADAAHNVRVAAEGKLKEAAHRVADKTSAAAHDAAETLRETKAHPEEWIGEERLQERAADAKSSATSMADKAANLTGAAKDKAASMTDTLKEKVRAGVHQAAAKVEEALTPDAAAKGAASFDLRAENQRIEDTAADALQREAQQASARRGEQYKTPTERVALEEEKERKAQHSDKHRVRHDSLVRAMRDKAEHDATVDAAEEHKREAHAKSHAARQQQPRKQQGRRQHEARA